MFVVIDTRTQTGSRLGGVSSQHHELPDAVRAAQAIKDNAKAESAKHYRPTIWRTRPGESAPQKGSDVGFSGGALEFLPSPLLAAWRELEKKLPPTT